MTEVELKITGMTCNHCAMAVRKELARLPGVDVKDVHPGLARIAFDEARVSTGDLRSAVEKAGYSVV
jgi:copper chaperone CopZ